MVNLMDAETLGKFVRDTVAETLASMAPEPEPESPKPYAPEALLQRGWGTEQDLADIISGQRSVAVKTGGWRDRS